ncbi:O-antigen ligase [Halomonas sp. QHL1]|uniref:O-antigen ligase family protein n=1 Tax=Halomonas sp. QHL1 TaxID=1123773 RepID=UPI0009F9CEA1|nr:O-antigen ligase family protein [Halomonas sp. QHL1]
MKNMPSIQEVRAGKAISTLNGLIIFGFATTLVLIPQAHWWFGVAALIASFLASSVVLAYRKNPLELTRDDFKLAGVLVLFGGVWSWSVFVDGRVPLISAAGFRHLYLWPFIAALFLLVLRIFTPSPNWIWLGVCCGALGAGLIAIYEKVIIGAARADNGINAIPFGNLSLLMGVISLVAGIYYIQQRRPTYYCLALLAFSAALIGFLASLFSGTRGGWVAIPFLAALLLLATKNLITPKARNIIIFILTLFVIALIVYPPSGVWVRLVAIFDDIYLYFVNDEPNTSLGTRFELWRAGWIMFIENPIMGIGEGAVQERLPSLVAREIAYEGKDVFPQLHSDIIDTLARRGLLGVISLLLLYGVFASVFAKKGLQASDNIRIRLLAISGMMVIIAFFNFGLSQAMFRDLRAFSGFLGFSIAIWGCLGHKAQAQPSSQPI